MTESSHIKQNNSCMSRAENANILKDIDNIADLCFLTSTNNYRINTYIMLET